MQTLYLDQAKNKPGRKKSDKISESILAACWQLLMKHPLNELTINALALESNTSRPAIYRRWSGIDEIVLEALLDKTVILVPLPEIENPIEALKIYIGSLADFINGQEGRVIIQVLVQAYDKPELMNLFREKFLRPRRQQAISIINHGQEQRLFKIDLDVELVLDLYAGPIYYRALSRHSPIDDDFLKGLTEQIIAGIITEKGQASIDKNKKIN